MKALQQVNDGGLPLRHPTPGYHPKAYYHNLQTSETVRGGIGVPPPMRPRLSIVLSSLQP